MGVSGVAASPIQPHLINWFGSINENLYYLREARLTFLTRVADRQQEGTLAASKAVIGSWLVQCANAVTRALTHSPKA